MNGWIIKMIAREKKSKKYNEMEDANMCLMCVKDLLFLTN
jgi:hypothetical protein